MKKIILFLFLFVSYLVIGQVSNEGKPKSWEFKNQFQSIAAIKMPAFNVEELLAEDAEVDHTGEKPWRFGKEFMVNYDLTNSGTWTNLEDGSRVWRIRFLSKEAKTLNFLFEDFYLPDGGTVYLYSNDKQDLLGAYTHYENNDERILGSWLVSGDDVWIEYYEPAQAIGEGALKVGRVIHGYRNQSDFSKALNWSGNCNQDVNCPIDPSLEDFKNHNKKGVVLLLVGTSSFCSGSLINNTNNNGVPYILTANHCYSNPSGWSFRFNWISPNPVCAQVTNSTNGPTNQIMSGATLRARRANSDFCLVQINNSIPSGWDVVWNGWSRETTATSKSFGIHHPSGDIMKVSVDMNSPSSLNNNGNYWRINNWELGTTEGGSSGSPLFDDNGRIIGQLWRGSAGCVGNTTIENGGSDDYGRFNTSWDAGGSPTTQLKEWLDPTNTGLLTLDSYPQMVVYDLDVAILVTNIDSEVCGNSIFPILEIKNNGLNILTSAEIIYNLNGQNPTTINWTGNLTQGQTDTINIPEINIVNNSSFSASVSNPNNGEDQNTMNNLSEIFFNTVSSYETEQVFFTLKTDNYGSETTWNLKNSLGTVLYSGGPYPNSNNPAEINLTFNLPTEDCYAFTINDQYGDGICCLYGAGFYRLQLPDGTIMKQGGSFGDQETFLFSTTSDLNIGAVANIEDLISLYPNPTNGVVNITNKSGEKLQYEVFNVLGQRMLKGNTSDTNFIIDLSFNSGIYMIKFTDIVTNDTIIKKVVVK